MSKVSTLEYIKQDTRPICGQVAVAVIAGVSLEEAIKAVGHEKGTTSKELISGLKKLGVKCKSKSQRVRKGYTPKTAIFHISPSTKKWNWHWVAFHDNIWYNGNRWHDEPEKNIIFPKGWKPTSYIEIIK